MSFQTIAAEPFKTEDIVLKDHFKWFKIILGRVTSKQEIKIWRHEFMYSAVIGDV